jgi:hypothetical protein
VKPAASSSDAAGDGSSLRGEATRYSAAYERLRTCVTGKAGLADGARAAGLGLVLQQGVPGWLKALARVHALAGRGSDSRASLQLERNGVEPEPHTAVTTIAPEILPFTQQADVTLVLANMVVSAQRIGCARSMNAQPGFPGGAA